MADNYEDFKKQILTLTGIDLNAYKENQMKRRIDSLITRSQAGGYDGYVRLIRENKDKFEEFVNYLTINVSEFWRNPEQWKILENLVLPNILKKDGLKIWSAACSTGDEPYSLVMLLNKYLPFHKIKITATDIDKQVLALAKQGVYTGRSVKGLPEDFKKNYFNVRPDGAYEVKSEVKNCVTFKEHNLLKDYYPNGCDLIVCRNVLIYFTEEAKDKIYADFYKSLNHGGYLFLGSTEQILDPSKFGFASASSFFYKKE